METFIIHIAKTGVSLGIFLVIYLLFLRPATFFRFNRLFLLFGFVASLIIPAIKYTYEVIIPVSLVQNVETTSEAITAAASASPVNVWIVLSTLYLVGVLALTARNLYVCTKLGRLLKSGVKYNHNGYKIIDSADVKSPFTVLNYILVNTSKLSRIEKDLILKHETSHISQKHWIDLLCCECILLLQWFNPLAWIYVKLLKENHEFLADKTVIDSGVAPALYKATLINQKFQGSVFSFSNSFNHSKPLNRLSMIKKAKSSPWKRAAALAIVPVFGLLLWASSEPRYVFEPFVISDNGGDLVHVTGHGMMMDIDNADSLITNKNKAVKVKDDSISAKIKTDGKTGFHNQDGKRNVFRFVNDTAKTIGKIDKIYKKGENIWLRSQNADNKKPMVIIDGEKDATDKLKNMDPSVIKSINVLKDSSATAVYGDDAKNGAIIVKTLGYAKNHPEEDLKKQQSKLTTVKDSVTNKTVDTKSLPVSKIISTKGSPDKAPLFFVDGKKVDDINSLDPNEIENFTVLKDKTAIAEYGDEGKNGVILIVTKKKRSYPAKIEYDH
ncbi:MAG: TonB-dependent receptor plug domain-containing protein [Prevotella sp.]|jgi:TonB-dependent SusC/RagA subfamily outer membrane receptor|nr:TonB-dependent receptor plug domain-containing protein [Prevotella sp.]